MEKVFELTRHHSFINIYYINAAISSYCVENFQSPFIHNTGG